MEYCPIFSTKNRETERKTKTKALANGYHYEGRIKQSERIEEYQQEQQMLRERIMKLELDNRSSNSDSPPNKHEGIGLLITNSQKEVINGIDLLEGHSVNNQSLTYLNFEVRGVQSGDESLAEMKSSWLLGQSREAEQTDETISIQMDNGGARTVASREFADHCKAPVLILDNPVKLQAFN